MSSVRGTTTARRGATASVPGSRESHTLVHDAMYLDEELPQRRGWGHSSASEAVALAASAGVKRLVLFHHDPGRTDDAVDAMLATAREDASRRAPGLEVLAARDGLVLQL